MALTYRVLLLPLLLVAAPIGLAAQAHAAAGGIGDMYITSDASNVVRAYSGTTGAYLGDHSNAVLGSGELGIHFGANNGLYLVGSFGGGVDEYNAVTGGYIKTYSATGGWQWAGLYGPNGNVYIGSMQTQDIRQYDVATGALLQILCFADSPADMRIGPNGHLYICEFNIGAVEEVNITTGFQYNQWFLPPNTQANDIAFLPSGMILVTAMGTNVCYRFTAGGLPLGQFAGTGWFRPHGIDINPADSNIYIVDGVTTQVHVFDPATFTELNPAFRNPDPEDKIVDIEFRVDSRVTPAVPTTWSKLKTLVR